MSSAHFFWSPEPPPAGSFPEEFSEEQRMIAAMTAGFVADEIVPRASELEDKAPGLMTALLQKAGELGLLGPDVPERWGGMGLDLTSSALITESLGAVAAYGVSHSDHTALGTLPIVLFGNEEQRTRYLPGLARGQQLGAYALTEGGSGSDALAVKTKAVLAPGGAHYVLNGTKQFVSNAGIADVFVAFARVGDRLTAFLVDKDAPGLSLGAEEHKMGISGSSTRSITFEDAQVPAGNVLFEIGKGHLVALTAVDVGRLKLAVQCVGAAKAALGHAARYALERQQFGKPIASFGLVQEKLGRMAASIYAAESMAYRAAARVGPALTSTEGSAAAGAIAAHAAECAMNKVFATEVLDRVADETVQIFGGYGYSKEYPAERIYRDARINRIFAGTNEINRLTVARGLLPPKAGAAPVSDGAGPTHDAIAREQRAVAAARQAVRLAARLAVEKHGDAAWQEQEIAALVADGAADVHAMEGALLRAGRLIAARGDGAAAACVDLSRSFCCDGLSRVRARCLEVVAASSASRDRAARVEELGALFGNEPENGIALRRRVAARVLDASGYPLC